MAVFNTLGYTTKPREPVYLNGKKMKIVPARVVLLTASLTNADQVILARDLNFADRIDMLFTPNASPALTSAVSSLGFMYIKPDGTLATVKTNSDTLLWSSVATLATAQSTRDLLLSANSALDTTKSIGELLGMGVDQQAMNPLALVLSFPTKPSVDGTLDLRVHIEEATTLPLG